MPASAACGRLRQPREEALGRRPQAARAGVNDGRRARTRGRRPWLDRTLRQWPRLRARLPSCTGPASHTLGRLCRALCCDIALEVFAVLGRVQEAGRAPVCTAARAQRGRLRGAQAHAPRYGTSTRTVGAGDALPGRAPGRPHLLWQHALPHHHAAALCDACERIGVRLPGHAGHGVRHGARGCKPPLPHIPEE